MGRKPRQRKNGDGTIITFRNKKKQIIGYAAELTTGWQDSKRQKVRSARYKERTEAEAALLQLRKQHQQGITPTDKHRTLRDYLAEWIADAALDHRPRTIEAYRWAIDRHIVPHIGDTEIGQISTPLLKNLIKTLKRQKLAPKSIGLVRTALRQALEPLVDDLFEYNPADRAKAPEVKKQTVGKALTIDQVAALIDAARGNRLDVALRLCFSFGLRRGEVCGLRWKDIDLDRGILTVNGTLGYVQGQGLMWGATKTENGQRSFKLPASLQAALRWHQTRQEAERKAMGNKWITPASADEEYVFVSVREGCALHPAQLYVAFRRVATAIGLEGYRLHDLRHSAASFLHLQRAPKKLISEFMGHANTRITDDVYTHLFQDELNEAADTIEQGLEAAIERRRITGGSSV